MIQIQKTIRTSTEVFKELTWFGLIKTILKKLKTARITALNCFKSMTFHNAHQKDI